MKGCHFFLEAPPGKGLMLPPGCQLSATWRKASCQGFGFGPVIGLQPKPFMPLYLHTHMYRYIYIYVYLLAYICIDIYIYIRMRP